MCNNCEKFIRMLEARPFASSTRWTCPKCGVRRFSKEATPGTSEKLTEWIDSRRFVKWWRNTWLSKNWPLVIGAIAIGSMIIRWIILAVLLVMSDGKIPTPPVPQPPVQSP